MRRSAWTLAVFTLSLTGLLANACGGDDEGGGGSGGKKTDSGTGGVSNGGTGGGVGGSTGGLGGSSGGGTGGVAGAAGGGETDASTGGTDAGTGGTDAGPDANAPVSLCGCTLATAADHTTKANTNVSFAPYAYTPNCIKINAGSSVTWSGDFTFHPLMSYVTLGTQPNPIVPTSSGTSKAITFSSTGAFGYRCDIHGQESEAAATMCGAVFVVP